MSEPVTLNAGMLQDWLDARLPGPATPLRVERVSGGASNITYRVRRGDESYALRQPSTFRNDSTADTFAREIRLLGALAGSEVPHARLIGGDVAGTILGSPFVLTLWIDGFSPKAPLPAGFRSANAAEALAWELTDALARISNEDYVRLGLTGFGKPEGFLDRQVDRWKAQLDRARSRDLAGIDELCDALRSDRPVSQRSSLIHGDYQFINVLFAAGAPPRLAAVIDWETATIGDPLLDLGWMLAGWQQAGEPPTHAAYMDWTEMPSRGALADRYAAATGLDVSRIDYYVALALFKLAAIMEGWYFQYINGRSKIAAHGLMKAMVPQMISRALHFAGARG